ncbi:uncharacterized protein LOC100168407 [Acyrthosiphon pisum]|uniref:Uncharacterized protein n=1 Tax=Acyrthosiphon pisum TaxID=7029 RepID=A0A8R2A5I5_ACYPI|nr:uncharacterized protein LOC100168407 [Acyrthosiphon pisum]|eukprot:XP_001948854.1 PREDICTED: uncharacterized protein LOC100168407 [Acyrthosiphon pisum]
MTSMLSFVLENVPSDWESVSTYNSSYILFDVNVLSREAANIKAMFNSTSLNINTIRRVQNPFQYGRFKLRQEMLNSNSVDTVFHIVHPSDLETALKYTCDYRRYKNSHSSEGENKHPRFYPNVQNAVVNWSSSMINDSCVLVVSKISGNPKTQSDYYVQYVVDFK